MDIDVESEDWLAEELAGVIGSCGAEPFLKADILVPETRHFPFVWQRDEAGVKVLAERLMAHAGLGDYRADVQLFLDDEADGPPGVPSFDLRQERKHKGPAAFFLGTDGQTVRFGCEVHNLPNGENMVGLMGHEVAHLFRQVKGVCREDRALEEYLTDITTVYLGFGVFTANASHRYSSRGAQEGVMSVTEWSHNRLGYLPASSFCFLLACQAAARAQDGEADRIARHLEPNQRAYFLDAFRDISENRGVLMEMLGLG